MLATYSSISQTLHWPHKLTVQPVLPGYDLWQKNLGLCMRGSIDWGPKLNAAEQREVTGWARGRSEEERGGGPLLPALSTVLPSDHKTVRARQVCAPI